MRLRLYPYRVYSKSVRLLASTLKSGLNIRHDGAYRYVKGDVIVNWGNSTVPTWMTDEAHENMLNKPEFVGIASHKIKCLNKLTSAGVPTLTYTTDQTIARLHTGPVYVRSVLQGHSGRGITIVNPGEHMPKAPLYTFGIENHGEYRVHVFKDKVIGYQKKSRLRDDMDQEGREDLIRTLSNGWIFRRGHLRKLGRIEDLARFAIQSLNLDFGAVDIIMDEKGNVFVLEINTAVGLSDSTITEYVEALTEYIKQ